MTPIPLEEISADVALLTFLGFALIFLGAAYWLFASNFPDNNATPDDNDTSEKEKPILKITIVAFTVILATAAVGLHWMNKQKETAINSFFAQMEEETGVTILNKEKIRYKDFYDTDDTDDTGGTTIIVQYLYQQETYTGILSLQEGTGQLLIPSNPTENNYVPFNQDLFQDN